MHIIKKQYLEIILFLSFCVCKFSFQQYKWNWKTMNILYTPYRNRRTVQFMRGTDFNLNLNYFKMWRASKFLIRILIEAWLVPWQQTLKSSLHESVSGLLEPQIIGKSEIACSRFSSPGNLNSENIVKSIGCNEHEIPQNIRAQ